MYVYLFKSDFYILNIPIKVFHALYISIVIVDILSVIVDILSYGRSISKKSTVCLWPFVFLSVSDCIVL